VRFHVGCRSEEGRGESTHFVALLLGIERSLSERRRMAVVPFACARSDNRLVVLRGSRGESAIISLISGDLSAVSMAHKVSFSFGGSIKRHDERRRWGSEKGVGHDLRPIHAMKKGGSPEAVVSQALVGEA
jgi:hypothetical protein